MKTEDLAWGLAFVACLAVAYVADKLVETRQAVDGLRTYVEGVEVEFIRAASGKKNDIPAV